MKSIVAAALLGLASAMNYDVEVGANGNTFTPNSIRANQGDTVTFKFAGSQHDVSQATFQAPCQPAVGGFYSGRLSQQDGKSFMITVNGTQPTWFYCSVARHCQGGMVGVINPAQRSAADFAQAASQVSQNTQPNLPGGSGGMIMSGTGSSNGGTSASSGSPSSTASGTSSGGSITSSAGAYATKIPAALALAAGAIAAYL